MQLISRVMTLIINPYNLQELRVIVFNKSTLPLRFSVSLSVSLPSEDCCITKHYSNCDIKLLPYLIN